MGKKKPSRILITYSWCRTAYVVIESLSKAGYEVFTCDPSPWSMGRFSKYTSGFDYVSHPFKKPMQFIEDIASIIRKRQIDILLPMHEDSLIVARYRQKLPRDLLVICPPYEEFIRAMDKNEINEIAIEANVNVPQKIVPSSIEHVWQSVQELGFPVIIKTRRGNSGKGVFFAQSKEDVRKTYEEIVERFNLSTDQLPILQKYIEGDLYGSCFLAKNGELKACFIEKYLRWKESKFGTSVLREPCEWSLLNDYTERMVRTLQWTGIGHFDFVASSKRNQAFLLEMNPRFWGALNLAVHNGYDFPLGLVTMYERGEPDPAAFSPLKHQKRSLWIVGEIIASVAEVRNRKWLAPFRSFQRIFSPSEKTSYDDFRWRDPLPLIIEMIYYGSHFFRSGYEINPIEVEMMR